MSMKTNASRAHSKPWPLAALVIAAAALAGCGGGGGDDGTATALAGGWAQATSAGIALETALATIPASALSFDEMNSLSFMREEEKLARDVYAQMFSHWGLGVFSNIGASEQAHMDAVLLLLTRYALPDPAATTLPGQFGNAALQALYDALLASGSTSLVNALLAGAEIEDVDIRDLRAIKAKIDNADLLLVYDNLEKGSRNHLRAFHANLAAQGVEYTPKYITQAEYDAIVNSPHERG
jgi:hypothetical protein